MVTSRSQFANKEQRLAEGTMTRLLEHRIVLVLGQCQKLLCQRPRLLEVASCNTKGNYPIECRKSLGRILSGAAQLKRAIVSFNRFGGGKPLCCGERIP